MKKKNIYLIQFGKSNEVLETVIKSLGLHYKYFETQWLLETELTPTEIYEKMEALGPTEKMFICKMDISNYWGRMDKKFWDWLKSTKAHAGT